MLGANGIVGAGPPIATGAALTADQKDGDRVALAFFGDGAVAQGQVHEAINLASTWDLPAIFVNENNQFGREHRFRSSTTSRISAKPPRRTVSPDLPSTGWT